MSVIEFPDRTIPPNVRARQAALQKKLDGARQQQIADLLKTAQAEGWLEEETQAVLKAMGYTLEDESDKKASRKK